MSNSSFFLSTNFQKSRIGAIRPVILANGIKLHVQPQNLVLAANLAGISPMHQKVSRILFIYLWKGSFIQDHSMQQLQSLILLSKLNRRDAEVSRRPRSFHSYILDD